MRKSRVLRIDMNVAKWAEKMPHTFNLSTLLINLDFVRYNL